jgi:hypothetical protein
MCRNTSSLSPHTTVYSLAATALIPKCKMASQQQKAECIHWFHESKSVTTVQRRFQTKFVGKLTSKESIRRWYDNYVTKGYICQGTSSSRPPASELSMDRTWEETQYRLDVCHMTRGAHIEHM